MYSALKSQGSKGKTSIILDTLIFLMPITRRSHSIKIDIGKSFDKSIKIDQLILGDIDFIGQSIKIDTHSRRSVNFIDFIEFIDRY